MLYVRSLQTLTTKAILRRMEGREQAKQVLKERYAELSKHAHYQTVPEVLAEKLGIQFEVNEEWRGDRPRYPLILDYARKHQVRKILDVGANTGFFSLSLAADIEDAAITACELNKTHAEIIQLFTELGGYANISVTDRPADLKNVDSFGLFDLALHLNILHHAGHDFDREHVPDRDAFMAYAVDYLTRFGTTTRRMVFQMGYNWGGDKTVPLVGRDDQAGKIKFTVELLQRSGWDIEQVALAKPGTGMSPVEYELVPLNELLSQGDLQIWCIERYGAKVWSEFYQRPLWFCRY